MMARKRYSIHLIRSTGPVPVDAIRNHDRAIDAAEEKAKSTKLEVRVWDTRTARCVYSVPAEVQHGA